MRRWQMLLLPLVSSASQSLPFFIPSFFSLCQSRLLLSRLTSLWGIFSHLLFQCHSGSPLPIERITRFGLSCVVFLWHCTKRPCTFSLVCLLCPLFLFPSSAIDNICLVFAFMCDHLFDWEEGERERERNSDKAFLSLFLSSDFWGVPAQIC